MATSHRIVEAVEPRPMGDMIQYFDYVDNMFKGNDGVNHFAMLSSDSYATSAPIQQDQYTKFKLTDTSMDIVDLSKGYINLKVEIQLKMDYKDLDTQAPANPTVAANSVKMIPFFIGFKSASHIINVYNVYSQGRLTACKNTKAKHEQALVYSCKAKEERAGRPGMYSPHKEVLNMTDCVCGDYIWLDPVAVANWTQQNIQLELDMCVQVDDLLPFCAMTYYPQFMYKDLELEISCNLTNNMVFCPIPMEYVIKNNPMIDGTTILSNYDLFAGRMPADRMATVQQRIHAGPNGNPAAADAGEIDIVSEQVFSHQYINTSTVLVDSRFHQCGEWAKCLLPLKDGAAQSDNTITAAYVTFRPVSMTIKQAKSYMYGFRIKEETKQILREKYADKVMKIPAQWIEHYTFSQQPSATQIETNIQVPMHHATQAILTFPNSAYQTTVSRNPQLNNIQCHIADRIIPDKNMSTLETAHSEMILNALELDSLFSAPQELLTALKTNRKTNKDYTIKTKDDSDYMLVLPLERLGSGCFNDGITGQTIPVNFTATYIEGINNPHYYELDVDNSVYANRGGVNPVPFNGLQFNLRKTNINLYIVSDCWWIFGENGGEFIKDLTIEGMLV